MFVCLFDFVEGTLEYFGKLRGKRLLENVVVNFSEQIRKTIQNSLKREYLTKLRYKIGVEKYFILRHNRTRSVVTVVKTI